MAVVLVLSTNRWTFKNEDNGEQMEGTTIQYIQEPGQPKDNSKGSTPMKISAPLDAFKTFDKVPGFYDITFDVVPGSGGKPKVVYDSAKFVRPVTMDFTKAAN